ncbi:GNAT family N-acetyltransferase [Phenylobacterium sp. J367]|uniref:GNAT family N-acetyltransferase n=1 Tax=Phenylobacterium sp. J367 TaxID=2898435 RepID=UPI002151E114|nr:GNAT family N-acetyltransferase [Phenylobacterium sp. J367]MCR5878252.1 GNAT family N-acetyltransferase [Phenylobacterium sp. J367]
MDDAGLTEGLAGGLTVRPARLEELPACADLYVKVLRDTFTWQPPERHRREDFARAAREEEIYVAVLQGRIVGLAGFYRPQNFLHSLYVTERGLGVGKALLDYVGSVAAGPVSLKVQAPNVRAQKFYAREGFVCVERGRDPGSDVNWLRLVRDVAQS